MIKAEDLQSHALFGGVSDESLALIIPLFKQVSFEKGATVVNEGEQGNRMFFIRQGSVEVVKNTDATPPTRQLAILGEGDSFGEMELIDVQPRSASVRALERLNLWTLSNEDMYEIYQRDKELFIIILMNIAREISRRLRKMDVLVASSLYGNANSLVN
ncbi:MAG: CRP/FNR family cyclic AMP-dependent transcriptional regulator [Gammaproteobacteria bacterium]|jgi:CRP/FNR family cyclic AMP-dependent transcriptional regulator